MPYKFIFIHGLYKQHIINNDNIWVILHLFFLADKDRYDYYCPECKDMTIYKGTKSWPKYSENRQIFEASSWSQIVRAGNIIIKQRFTNAEQAITDIKEFLKNTTFTCEVFCSRNEKHKITSYFQINEDKLIKIGQYPSMATLDFGRLNKYRKLLNKKDSEELGRAIGL